jgi:hypothetical protein
VVIRLKYTPLGGLALADKNVVYSGAEALASFSFNIGGQRLNSPTHPITWYNVDTKKAALTLNMLSDSGADYSTIDAKHAATLGVNLRAGTPATVQGTGGQVETTFYIHQIPFKIGPLHPKMALVAMGSGAGTDVFGRTAGLNWFDVTYNKNKVTYTELAQAQYAHAYRRRI